ncbi:hypothetical protein L195_g050376 [Trifolium pratense]|uniref:Uncharacterized protein n=1 Tax=Trifolium pratense TaxID=57577 RepID=A0A2K3JTN7_TRIPR|nr:hypothetical protein L195_g050376 [Trifolium pratense]
MLFINILIQLTFSSAQEGSDKGSLPPQTPFLEFTYSNPPIAAASPIYPPPHPQAASHWTKKDIALVVKNNIEAAKLQIKAAEQQIEEVEQQRRPLGRQ